MKQFKKRVSFILVLCIIISMVPVTAWAASEVTSGTCGKNVTWVLTDDGTLTISGQGAMTDYESASSAPWNVFWVDYRDQIITVVIDDGVTTIGDCVFQGCENLSSVKIPDSVTSIGNESFYSCGSLSSITIPNSVTTIGEYAFLGCSSLTSVTIPDSVTAIGRLAFQLCDSLTGIWVDDENSSYYSDTSGVLFNKEKTRLIKAPNAISGSYLIVDGVTTIDEYAFYSCDELTSVTIADSVTTIGKNAFSYCYSITNMSIGDGIVTIPDDLFNDCSNLRQLSIGSSISEIDIYSFLDCSGLTEIWVDDNNAYYSSDNSGVLYNKDKTQLVFAPNALNGEYSVSDSAITIGEYAFYKCNSLTRVMIPESVTFIGERVFCDCTALTEICVDEKNAYFSSDDFGVLFDKNKSLLISVPGTITGEYLVPNSVTNICEFAFYNCDNLTSVSIAAGITSVPDYAFYGCDKLSSVRIPQSVTEIGWWAFAYSGITSITIPENVSFIDRSAFVRCYELSEIIFEGDAPYFRSVDYDSNVGEFLEVSATAYYPADNTTWTSSVKKNYGGYIIWVSYEPEDNDKETSSSVSVRFFQSWDAENQIAYFDSAPSENPTNLGSQVTEETDTSFLEKVDELVSTYVLAETKIRNDGMIAPDTLISILPVETKSGTVTANDGLTISIDGVEYTITERLGLVLYDAGGMVTYHLYNGELVGIRDYNPDAVNPELPDDPDPEEPEDDYHMVVYPYGSLTIEAGDTLELTCSLYNGSTQMAVWEQPQLSISHKEDTAPISYEGWSQHHAGSYTLTVKGVSAGIAYLTIYDAVTEEAVEITVEVTPSSLKSLSIKYNDALEKKEKTAQVNWGYSLFREDARSIENSDPASYAELVKISALLCQSTYDLSDGGYLQQILNQLGTEEMVIAVGEEWDTSYPAHSISHVKFYQDDGLHDLIIVTIRGTQTIGDILTDITAWADEDWESPKEHPGFSLAKDRIKNEIKTYLTNNGIAASKSKILITGHSYGGAVANLLANSLEDVFDQRDIYAYTFASPNTIVVDSNLVLGSNIHNFRNAWDPVVRIPVALLPTEKYTVFGQQHFFTLEEIGDTSEGIDIGGNHNCTHYVNYAFNLVAYTVVDSLQTRCVQVHCPVDVTAYDRNGNVIGQITDNQLNESSTSILMFPVSDQKNIFIDQNEDVQLSIVATDSGTMDVIITEYDVVTGNVLAIKAYSCVGLVEGKDFYTSISNETATADIVLEVVDNEGNRLAVVNEDGTETADISEKHKHSIEIQNIEEATCTETGYSGDEVCSECGTVVKKGFEISTISHDYKAVVTNATCTDDGYTTFTCSGCGDIYIGDPVTKLGHDMSDPTCTVAKICKICGTTDGEALGHVDENIDKKCDRCSMSLETEQSGNTDRPSVDNPQTGDNISLKLWITLLILSFVCAIVCICCGKKRNLA